MKKNIVFILILIILFCTSFTVKAHNANLEIVYDDCQPTIYGQDDGIGDGYNEKWYNLIDSTNHSIHIPSNNEIFTVRYYFADQSRKRDLSGNTIKWDILLTSEQVNYLKNGIANSLKKWNNVYFYINNGEYYIKKRIINVIEGTEDNHNLIILPSEMNNLAITKPDTLYMNDNINIPDDDITHIHSSRWQLEFSISEYFKYLEKGTIYSNFILERTGAHELGHLLGLSDIDKVELNSQTNEYHHEEVLMGYSPFTNDDNEVLTLLNRQTEITYRDIAGAAIIRGLHNDNNHKWLCDEQLINNQYKLICSICNGVKYVNSLENFTYDDYNSCNANHELSDGNMMPVACYGNKDYYKCKFCRYVAPFSSIIEQNYISNISYNSYKHYIINNVLGLEYRMLEDHEFNYNVDYASCIHCNFNVSMNDIIVTDPDYLTNCGSQINVYEQNLNLYEKSYRSNTIVEGYTRLLYFTTSIAPSISRLDYNWFSSDSTVATVSNYGTVTALNVSEPTQIIISAEHKYSDIILYKRIWIIPDNTEISLIINYEIEMNVGESFVFSLDEASPTLSLSNYTWEVLNQDENYPNVEMSEWGTINAFNVGITYIEGRYNLNCNVIIIIKITIN